MLFRSVAQGVAGVAPEVQHPATETLTAIQTMANLMSQLVTPLLQQHQAGTSTPPPPQPVTLSTTPQISHENSSSRKRGLRLPPRRSVRIKSQGADTVPVMTRATTRVQSRYNLRSAVKGNSLLSNFPYNRLTNEEILELFRAYHITLGCSELSAVDIIQALKHLDRQSFDILIRQAFSILRDHGSEHALRIVKDDQGHLVVQ